jgi:16S rRNA (guanine527-N7)-methyltransferase
MELSQIREGLQPFLKEPLAEPQLQHVSIYMDTLLRWNARVNLTSVRQPEQIITRHFGESIFAAQHLFGIRFSDRYTQTQEVSSRPKLCVPLGTESEVEGPAVSIRGQFSRETATAGANVEQSDHLIDLGSGAGFPGLPIKICYPALRLTLIESSHKKATFLREVVRSLALTNVDVFCGRAESYGGDRAAIVTLRAVERFDQILPVAAGLVGAAGRLALLIGAAQCARVVSLTPGFQWNQPIPIPLSDNRVLLIGGSEGNQSRYESA